MISNHYHELLNQNFDQGFALTPPKIKKILEFFELDILTVFLVRNILI